VCNKNIKQKSTSFKVFIFSSKDDVDDGAPTALQRRFVTIFFGQKICGKRTKAKIENMAKLNDLTFFAFILWVLTHSSRHSFSRNVSKNWMSSTRSESYPSLLCYIFLLGNFEHLD
jgi:hypothetical protein